MKASVKLRPQHSFDPDRPATPAYLPLLRVKLPATFLGLPLLTSFTADPSPAFHLRTLLPSLPSLGLSLHPPSPLSDHPSSSLSLSLKLSLGPLTLSSHLPLSPPPPSPTFSLRFTSHLGDFSFTKSTPLTLHPPQNPNFTPKPNGGGVHRPLPLGRIAPPWAGEWTGLDSGLTVTTRAPATRHAQVKVRWGVRLPPDADGAVGRPFLVVDKISVERVVDGREGVEGRTEEGKDGDVWVWIRKEAEELRREQVAIRDGIEGITARIGGGDRRWRKV